MNPSPSTSNRGKRKLRGGEKEIIADVLNFMKKEAEDGISIPLTRIHERVSAACGVSVRTLSRISKEGIEVSSGKQASFTSPRKSWKRRDAKSDVDEFDVQTLRRTVHNLYVTEVKPPTLATLLPKIRESTEFDGQKTCLYSLMKKHGFRWKRRRGGQKYLMEQSDIRLKRIEYLRRVINYREEGRHIIYTDETYVHSPLSLSCEPTFEWSQTPVFKGQRLIIVHAGGDSGFVPNGLLILNSGMKPGDLHGEMNSVNYMSWIENQLMPNIPPNSVVVMDNAPYHNTEVDRVPSSSYKKEEMRKWLGAHGVFFEMRETKVELYEKIKLCKPITKSYLVNQVLAQRGHTVLRLPPYHPELNPIEHMWRILKNWLAARNVRLTMKEVEKLLEERFDGIGLNEWMDVCAKVKSLETEYLQRECVMDEIEDEIGFLDGDISESDFESESDLSD